MTNLKSNPLLLIGSISLTFSIGIAAAAVVTHYKGLVDIRFNIGVGSGQIVIDGRSEAQPRSQPLLNKPVENAKRKPHGRRYFSRNLMGETRR